MKTLVVDDEEMKRRPLREDLSGWGYEVVAAADGHEALAASPSERRRDATWASRASTCRGS